MFSMLPLTPLSWLFPLLISRYVMSGHVMSGHVMSGPAHVTPPPPHERYLSSNSTARMNESMAGPSSPILDFFNSRSNSLTAASTEYPNDSFLCPQQILDDQSCGLTVGGVDIYFWPDPSRDTSCLSIIGNANNPPMQDASTSTFYIGWNNSMETTVYWGCTARDSTAGASFITTAVLATTGSLSEKKYLFNPWSSQPCSAEAIRSISPISQPHEARGSNIPAHVRRHLLLLPSGITQKDSLSVATVTSGNFTFTSPSIYVDFHEVSVMEVLGAAVCTSFPVPMLSFSPGELSTIEGLHSDSSFLPEPSGVTKVFNFTDLPCPPQSVMEANWYTPEPGQPYRPLIAVPRQLQAWNPAFANCKNFYFFRGYDPPRALVPATAMAPIVTQAEPQTFTIAPRPSATPDPGPKETNLASSPQEGGIWQTTSSPKSQIGTDEDPKQKTDPSVSPINNANEKSGQQTYPERPAQGNTDTGSDQGAHFNADSSKDSGDNPGQVGQQQSNGGLVNDPESRRIPESTSDQQGNVISIGSLRPGQIATVNSHIIQVLRDAVSIAGTTLSSGAPPITVSGTPIALDSGNLVVGSFSVRVAQPPLSLISGKVTKLNGVIIKQLGTGISVSGSNLTIGGPAIKISGTLTSLGSNVLVIGTSSILFATDDPTQVVTTIAGQMITANPTAVEVGSSTLTPGGPGLTLSGTLVSLNYAGQLVVGSKTIPPPNKSSGGEEFMTAVAGQGLTANLSAVQIGGSELGPGGPRNMSGGPNASESVGSENVVNTKNDTGKGVQAFQGGANALTSRSAGILLLWLLCACLIGL